MIQTALFFMWDGVGFFNMDDTKLARLRGDKPTVFDRCKSFRWSTMALIFFSCIVLIMYNEALKLGTKKSQSITLVDIVKEEFRVDRDMPLVAAIYFWMDELLPKINAFQNRTGLHKPLPAKFDDYDYHDQMFMQDYLCNNTRVFIKEYKYVDVIGYTPYNYVYLYDWDCQMMPWANNRIRLNYFIGLHKHSMKGVFYNESVHNYTGFDKTFGLVDSPSLFDNITEQPVEFVETFTLRKEISYFSAIYCKYSEEFQGLNNLLFIFTTEKFANKTVYNNWNFTTPTLWDEFWFDKET